MKSKRNNLKNRTTHSNHHIISRVSTTFHKRTIWIWSSTKTPNTIRNNSTKKFKWIHILNSNIPSQNKRRNHKKWLARSHLMRTVVELKHSIVLSKKDMIRILFKVNSNQERRGSLLKGVLNSIMVDLVKNYIINF